jgi:hypothetical protein
MHAARRLVGAPAALVAMVFFYAAPLQRFGMLALPTALMVSLACFGLYSVLFRPPSARTTRWVVAGALSLVLALMVSPTGFAAALTAGTLLLLLPAERSKIVPLVSTAFIACMVGWLLLHVASDGHFTEVVRLQASRFAHKRGFDAMLHYREFRRHVESRGVTTAIGWNLSELRLTYFSHFPVNMNLVPVLFGGLGAIVLVRRGLRGEVAPVLALAPILWLVLALGLTLFVLEPAWDHYFLQYLAPLSLLSAVFVDWLWSTGRATNLRRVAVALLLVAFAWLGMTLRPSDPAFYEHARALAGGHAPLVTFDPMINLLTNTEPGCGVIDPFNTYGDYSSAAAAREGPLGRFEISETALIACLDRDPATRVVIGPFYHWFRSDRLDRYLEGMAPERLIFLTSDDRLRFATVRRMSHQ